MDRKLLFNGALMRADLNLDGGAVELTGGLETAVIISLFTDRRARADDVLPEGDNGDRRGWWADAFGDRPIGSRLWLLGREKQLPVVVARAKEYAEEALAWLVEDKVASRIVVTAEIVRQGMLGLAIEISRTSAAPVSFRFTYVWSNHAA